MKKDQIILIDKPLRWTSFDVVRKVRNVLSRVPVSEDLIKTIIWIYLGILFSLLLVIFFITRFISNRLWQPFYDTLKRIEQFNIEQHNSPIFNAAINVFIKITVGKITMTYLGNFDLNNKK